MGDSGARLRLPVWRSNDFALADATAWPTVGRDLLDEVMRRAESAGIEKAIVVSGPASVDKAKTAFLSGVGLRVEAEWRVKPLVQSDRRVPEKEGFDADIWSSATRL